MYDEDSEFRDLLLERRALEFLLAHACETLLFYADRGNYNAADDGMEDAAMDVNRLHRGRERRLGAGLSHVGGVTRVGAGGRSLHRAIPGHPGEPRRAR
jgi:hypothetical protein